MRYLVALAFLATVYAGTPDECVWGESYWCSSIKTAKKCDAFDHCMTTVWANKKLEKDSTDICQFCENIIKDVRDFVDDKNNQKQALSFLTNACNIIPDEKLADLCKSAITDDFDQLIQMIDSELDAATICSAMGLCKGLEDTALHRPIKPVLKAGTDVCEFCEAVIGDIRAVVDDKKNQQQIKDMLNGICNMVPDPEMQNMCKEAVIDEFNQIIAMIDSQLDPATVCKQLKLCAAKKLAAKDALCDECQVFMMEVKTKLSEPAMEKEVQELIETQLCAQAGQYEEMCKIAVETYLPQIMQMLSSDVDPAQICSALGFCTSTPEARTLLAKLRLQKSAIFAAVPAGGAEECLLCKTVLGELQNIDRSEAMQQEVENFLKKNLCGMMGTLQGVCEQTVVDFAPELFELLANELNPDEFCAAIGFCSAQPIIPAAAAGQSVESVLRAVLPVSMPKSGPPKVPQPVSSPVSAGPTVPCELCELVIKYIDSELSDNATEAEIVKAVDEVCDILPDTVKETCEQFVAQYGPTVIALLLQELDPNQVCAKLGLCPSEKKLGASTECILCEFVMTQVDQLLNENSTESEIIAALDKVCSLLPKAITPDCTDFVNTYGPAVIALLKQELAPDQICTALGFCQAKKQLVKAAPAVKDAQTCGICEVVIQYVDSLMVENATINDIKKALDKVCNFLPDTMRNECATFVDQYGPAIIEMIAQALDPKTICVKIGLCDKSTAAKTTKAEEYHKAWTMLIKSVKTKLEKKETNVVEEKIIPVKVHLLGEDDCTMGPAFWCLNMENALKCNGVTHCKEHVWN